MARRPDKQRHAISVPTLGKINVALKMRHFLTNGPKYYRFADTASGVPCGGEGVEKSGRSNRCGGGELDWMIIGQSATVGAADLSRWAIRAFGEPQDHFSTETVSRRLWGVQAIYEFSITRSALAEKKTGGEAA